MDATLTPAASPTVLKVLVGVGGTLVVLILTQSALAGQFLFKAGEIDLHGYIGNACFALGVAGLAVALFGRAPRVLMTISALLLLALFGQIGLGYSGRESASAASFHIPLGVTCLGLSVWLVSSTLNMMRRPLGA